MTTTKVQTFFRINNEFILADRFSGPLPDKNYVEGAIVCRINGKDVFQLEHCDLVDQLWAYIVEGLGKLADGSDYDVIFPDQPLRLRFKNVPPQRVKVSIGHKSVLVDSAVFRTTMKRGALEFFSKMKAIHPEALSTWERYEKKAAMISE